MEACSTLLYGKHVLILYSFVILQYLCTMYIYEFEIYKKNNRAEILSKLYANAINVIYIVRKSYIIVHILFV